MTSSSDSRDAASGEHPRPPGHDRPAPASAIPLSASPIPGGARRHLAAGGWDEDSRHGSEPWSAISRTEPLTACPIHPNWRSARPPIGLGSTRGALPMDYRIRTRSTVGKTCQTVYADGDIIHAGGIDWTVVDAEAAILRGTTAKAASVELARPRRAVVVTIDGVDVGVFDGSAEVDEPRLAAFLDAVFGDLEADWRARAAALEAGEADRAATRRDELLVAFAAADLGPSPTPRRCRPSDLLLRLRRQRRHAGDAEIELRHGGLIVDVADLPGVTLHVFTHKTKGKADEVADDRSSLIVRISARPDVSWPRWEEWEGSVVVGAAGPHGYAITGEPAFVAAVAGILDRVGAWQVDYLPGYRIRAARRDEEERERLAREAEEHAEQERNHQAWMERARDRSRGSRRGRTCRTRSPGRSDAGAPRPLVTRGGRAGVSDLLVSGPEGSLDRAALDTGVATGTVPHRAERPASRMHHRPLASQDAGCAPRGPGRGPGPPAWASSALSHVEGYLMTRKTTPATPSSASHAQATRRTAPQAPVETVRRTLARRHAPGGPPRPRLGAPAAERPHGGDLHRRTARLVPPLHGHGARPDGRPSLRRAGVPCEPRPQGTADPGEDLQRHPFVLLGSDRLRPARARPLGARGPTAPGAQPADTGPDRAPARDPADRSRATPGIGSARRPSGRRAHLRHGPARTATDEPGAPALG